MHTKTKGRRLKILSYIYVMFDFLWWVEIFDFWLKVVVIWFLIMSISISIDIGGSGYNMMLSGLSRSVPRWQGTDPPTKSALPCPLFDILFPIMDIIIFHIHRYYFCDTRLKVLFSVPCLISFSQLKISSLSFTFMDIIFVILLFPPWVPQLIVLFLVLCVI